MTESEKIQRAKMYIDKLANGIDPITDTLIPQDNILNNVRLSRCFCYVSDILRQIIENECATQSFNHSEKPKRKTFHLIPGQKNSFSFSLKPVRISDIVKQLNENVDTSIMRKISATTITNWLLEIGLLERTEMLNGKRIRIPTKQGAYVGLTSQLCQSPEGEYYAVMYNIDAQHFILDNLETILHWHDTGRKKHVLK